MYARTGALGVLELRIETAGYRSTSDPTRERARIHLEKAIAMVGYLFAERLAWKERQIWPSRTRSHCRAQIEFVMFAGN